MVPCVDMSLLAVNCIPQLHWALEAGWEALPSPKWAAQWGALLACSPCLGRCSCSSATCVYECRSARAKPKPESFQWILKVQTTKCWHWCSSSCRMSLWELMKPRNSRGDKERKKWGKREARQKKEVWCNAPALVPGPGSQAWPVVWEGKEVTVTSPPAELLPGAWPGL